MGKFIAIGGLIVLFLAAVAAAWKWLPTDFSLKGKQRSAYGNRIAQIIEPTSGRPAFEAPGIKVEYRDMGTQVVIDMAAAGTPILFVQRSLSGAGVDARGDLSYAAYPDGSRCIELITKDEAAKCGSAPSDAKSHVSGNPGNWEVSWTIPKQELSAAEDGVDVAFEIFNEAQQRGTYFPDPPFGRIYRLHFLPLRHEHINPPGLQGESSSADTPSQGAEKESGTSSITAERDAGVQSRPAITTFDAEPQTIEQGGNTELRWAVHGSSQIHIEPALGTVPSAGRRTVSPSQTTLYELKAESSSGVVKRSLTVVVNPATPVSIFSFRAEPPAIEKGSSTILRWYVSGAASVRIEPGLQGLPAQGEATVTPAQTTDYTLIADAGGHQGSAQLRVRVSSPERPSIFFEAVPQTIKQGQAAELRWSTQNADHVAIEPGIGAQSRNGTISVAPQRNTRYTLTADGLGGSSTRDVLVSVAPLGPSTGEIVWTGTVHGVQLVTIDKDQVDVGSVQGALPGLPCIIQPSDERHVSIGSSPGPRNNYERLVLRVTGNGPVRVTIKWSLQ